MLELKGTFKGLVQLLNFLWDVWVPESLGLAQGHNKFVRFAWASISNASRSGMGPRHVTVSKTLSFYKGRREQEKERDELSEIEKQARKRSTGHRRN